MYSIGNMQYFTTLMHILQKRILILDSGHILMNYVPSHRKFFFECLNMVIIGAHKTMKIKAVASCSTHKIDQQVTDR